MFKKNDQIVYSPSDLTCFLESQFASWMSRYYIEDRSLCPAKDLEDALMKSLAAKGYEHEDALEQQLINEGYNVVKITGSSTEEKLELTLNAMSAGKDVIVQGCLTKGNFTGHSDFLVRVDGTSNFGNYHYEVWDTKLASKVKPSFLVQLCCYAEMLETVQGFKPEYLTVALGTGEKQRFRTTDYYSFYTNLKNTFLQFHQEWSKDFMPDPAEYDNHGQWSNYAKSVLLEQDHLSQVATITKGQIKKLQQAKILTMNQLSLTTIDCVEGMQTEVFKRLKAQAQVQCETLLSQRKKPNTKPCFRVIPHQEGMLQGLALLPPHSTSDIFFDIEGYPLDKGGLEYLWGATYLNKDGKREFKDFWAHNEEQEKLAFKSFIEWAYALWLQDQTMHIYHYANYEIAACRKLMGKYGVCEFEVDQLLRNDVFVDLYKIVKGSIILGEPKYSIKNVEHLYRGKRDTEVASGGDSVYVYEEWRNLNSQGIEGDSWETSEILNSIRDYNIDDCNSTQELVEWLRNQQQKHNISYLGNIPSADHETSEEITERIKLRENLLVRAKMEKESGLSSAALTENMAWVLEFHRRESKPVFWRLFDRLGLSTLDLIDDLDSLANCTRTSRDPFKPTTRARNYCYEYNFDPTQEFKATSADFYVLGIESEDGKPIKAKLIKEESNLEHGIIVIQSKQELPQIVSLIPDEYVHPDPIPSAIENVVKDYQTNKLQISNPAIIDFLSRAKPRFLCNYDRSHNVSSIAPSKVPEERLQQIIEAVLHLDSSYLTIQGPPGAGKSYTGKHIIAELLKRGLKVGISSNSHKAINNLLISSAQYCEANNINAEFFCTSNTDKELDEIGVNITSNNKLAQCIEPAVLVGTTAWGYCRDDMVETLDYLIIDEAGQVSIANLIGMSRSTKNIILMGDQMQLGQPSQGSHPAESGLSILDYLLHQNPTIADDMGVFLGTTYRMHSSVNKFISNHIYEGKLNSHPSNDKRIIKYDERLQDSLVKKEAGIVFVPVIHHGNSQASDEEADKIYEIAQQFIGRIYENDDPERPSRPITLDDMLFVAPYNHQVSKLRQRFGENAKIGSVDKFQGQEAPIVFLSMCASDPNDSPRGMDFLFDRNRINVAISRAKCLAIVVASPQINLVSPGSTEQMRLVNMFNALTSYEV